MRNYLDILLEELLSRGKVSRNCLEKDLHTISQKQIKLEFRKILDKLAINIIENNLENEMLKSSPFTYFKSETHKKGFMVMPKLTNFCLNILFRTKILYIFPYYGIITI